MASRGKVVRVEDLANAGSGVHFHEDTFFKNETDSNFDDRFELPSSDTGEQDEGSAGQGIISSTGGSTEGNEGVVEEEELPSEAEDMVMPLPENWPKISQLFEKRSWNFSTAVHPTINKATCHLELLQNIIEEWNESERDIYSRASSRKMGSRGPCSQASSLVGSKRQLRFTSGSKTSPSKYVPLASETSDVGSVTEGLSVQGIGALADGQSVAHDFKDEDELQVPYLGADEVIEEVITLLAKLENDRQETLNSLKQERQRVGMLSNKVDTLAMSRLMDLPAIVQREHEACGEDLSELNWHVNYSSRIEGKITNKTEVAESLNTKLKEDIDFVRKHIPLVREKLELELEAMSRIKQAQGDTRVELSKTENRADKANNKSEEAHGKATHERTNIKRDLDGVRDDLNDISEELSEAKMTHNAHIHQCNDLRQQLVDNDQELKVLVVKNENCKAAEAMQAVKVQDLEKKLVEAEFEYKTLEEDNREMMQMLEERKNKYTDAEEQLNRTIDKNEDKYKKIYRRNQELDMDMEDCNKKSITYDNQHSADIRNVERMKKELARTEEQLNQCREDLANVTLTNGAIRDQLLNEEDKCLSSEEQLRATADALRKQIKEEIHSKTVMAARIQSDGSELVKSQADTKSKKERASAKADEVTGVVKTILAKVEKLRKAHAEKIQVVNALKAEIQAILDKQRAMEEENTKKIEEITPDHKAVKTLYELEIESMTDELHALGVQQTTEVANTPLPKTKHETTPQEVVLISPPEHNIQDPDVLLTYEKKLDHIEWKTEMMTKKMDDMAASSGMMSRAVKKTQTAIDTLQEELDELNIQIQSTQNVMEELKASIGTIDSRMEMLDKNNRDMMKDRSAVHQQHEQDLTDNIKLNKELASRYRRLQNEHLALKNVLLNKYDGRVKLENAIKDTKQLQSLQKKMHSALLEYFKYRGLYNQSELGRMESESFKNGSKVSKLQVQMDMALEKISDFLKNQLDGDSIRRMAMERVAAEERGEVVQEYSSRPTTAATSVGTAY